MAELCHWLCVFVKEVRRDDGKPYTPRSFSQLLSGIQRFINSKRAPTQPLLKHQMLRSGNYRTSSSNGFESFTHKEWVRGQKWGRSGGREVDAGGGGGGGGGA